MVISAVGEFGSVITKEVDTVLNGRFGVEVFVFGFLVIVLCSFVFDGFLKFFLKVMFFYGDLNFFCIEKYSYLVY